MPLLISNPCLAQQTNNQPTSSPNILIGNTTLIKASNTDNEDRFGHSIALSSSTLVVGAPREDSNATGINNDQGNNNAVESGAVYVFTKQSGVWSQQAYIKASNSNIDDQFGYAVAVSGNLMVVGAPFESSNATGVNGLQTNNSAFSSGAAYVFVRAGNSWSQQAYLKASNTNNGDLFGSQVAINDQTIVIGAPGEASNSTGINGSQSNNSASASGAVYVFTQSGSNWSQQAYIKASNTDANDLFGFSVAIDQNSILVGAPGESSNATGVNGDQSDNSLSEAGACYAYVRDGNSWSQQAYLKASNTGGRDKFCVSVDISGNSVVIGAPGQDQDINGASASFAGAAYVFKRSANTWAQQDYLKGFNTGTSDQFGFDVAISGTQILIGANGEDSNATGFNGNGGNNSANNSGAAYTFNRVNEVWQDADYIKASNTGSFDEHGFSVAIDGGMVLISAQREGSNDVGVGGIGNNNSAGGSGAVYAQIDDLIFKDDFQQ